MVQQRKQASSSQGFGRGFLLAPKPNKATHPKGEAAAAAAMPQQPNGDAHFKSLNESGARRKENKTSGGMRRGFLLSSLSSAAPSTSQKNKTTTKAKANAIGPSQGTSKKVNHEPLNGHDTDPINSCSSDYNNNNNNKNVTSNTADNDNDRSSKARAISSSALLDLEDHTTKSFNNKGETQVNNSSMLLVSGENNNDSSQSKSNKSVNPMIILDEKDSHVMTDHNNKDALGLTEITSSTIRRKKGTLISEYDHDNQSNSTSWPQQAEQKTNGGSKSRDENDLCLGEESTSQECGDTNDKDGLQPQEAKSPASEGHSQLKTTLPPPPPLLLERTDFIQCQQDLDRVLWRIRRKKKCTQEWRTTAVDFSSEMVVERPELLPWIWECLMAACPKESTQNLAERRLGLVLLSQTTSSTEQWDAFASFLSPSQDKESRVLTLGAVTLLEFWMADQNEEPLSQTPEWMVDLLVHVIPALSKQVTTPSTRTVLAQRAVEALYALVNATAEYCEKSPDRNTLLLQQELWRLSSTCLVAVWDAQLAWNSSKTDDNDSFEGRRSAARKNCQSAVLRDWKRTVDTLVQHPNDQRAQMWCKALGGVKIDEDSGISIGSLGQTLLKSKNNKLSCENIPTFLKKATVQEHSEGSEKAREQQQAAIVRGVLAWLGQSKKHFSDILDSSQVGSSGKSVYQEVFEASSDLLRYALSDGIVDLALETLYALWADSYGLPGDLVAICDLDNATSNKDKNAEELPDSLKHWISLLDRNGAPVLDASREALSTLIAQSIVQLCVGTNAGISFSKLAISNIMERYDMEDATVCVLVTTLKVLQISAGGGDDQIGEQRRKELLDYIGCDLLLENLETNTVVRQAIKREQTLRVDPLSECSVARVVPLQVRLIAKVIQGPKANGEVITILAVSLTAVLRQSLLRGTQCCTADKQITSNTVVAKVVEALMLLMEENEARSSAPLLEKRRDSNSSKLTNSQLMEKICFQFGETWRQSLLHKGRDQLDTQGFGVVLTSIGGEMFRSPSSTIPLTLFGSVLGDSLSYEDEDGKDGVPDDKYKKESINVAVTALIRLAVCELDGFQNPQQTHASSSTDEIFGRLAPLLLLRRAPPSFFRAAYKEWFRQGRSRDDPLRELLARLASHISSRLDIGVVSPSESNSIGYSAEERQMAAELAGRCLPFNNGSLCQITAAASVVDNEKDSPRLDESEYGFFQRIGLPGFSGMMGFLLDTDRPCDENARNLIRRARASLYAVCHYIPFAKSSDDQPNGEALLCTAAFCLQFLHAELERFEATAVEQDMHQLQAGCIEFFAVCLEKTLIFRCQSKEAETDSLASYFEILRDTLLELLQSGQVDRVDQRKWLVLPLTVTASPLSQHQKQSNLSFSVPCRTCLWNSLIVVSQRCPEQSEILGRLAKESLPWLVTWGAGCYERNPPEHALCMTAALQFTFILITRTKSFVGLNGSSDVQKLHRWGLRGIRDSNGLSDYANNSLRCAGLKLLLAIVTIGQIITENSTTKGNSDINDVHGPSSLVFSPRDLQDTFTVLEEIATNDPDPKVQALANHVLGAGLR